MSDLPGELDSHQPPLHTRELTWAALLGHWAHFAKSALALPDDDAGRAMRRSVPDIIMLQAVCLALGDMAELSPAERALGLDRAQVLIEKHGRQLHDAWRGQSMPELLKELMGDARAALAGAGEER